MLLAAAALVLTSLAASPAPTLAPIATVETTLTAVRTDTPLALDASLSAPQWQSAHRIGGFTEAVTRVPAPSKTNVAVFYDDKNVYVGFWCEQTQPLTTKQLTNNVNFGTDDYVGIGIDPSGNADRAYYFEITPAGTRFQQASESSRYQPHWQGAAKADGTTWTAMLIIPLSVMRLPAKDIESWRINFVRFIASDTQKYTWSYSAQMDTGAGFPDLADARFWRNINGIQLAKSSFKNKPAADFFALSSSGGGRDQFVAPDGTTFTKEPRLAGLDLTYPLTSTINFVGALSPDFSNVDADQQTITPQVLPRNLVEYRPFFAQGANYINNAATALSVNEPPNVTFYSPSIATFDRGFKAEGTYGKYQSFGLLDARGSDPTNDNEPFDDIAFGWKHALPNRTFAYWTNGVFANHDGVHDDTIELATEARDLRTGWVGAFFHEQEYNSSIGNSPLSQSTYGFIDHQNFKSDEYLFGFRDIGPYYNPVDGYTQISDIHGFTGAYSLYGSMPAHSPLRDGNIYLFADRYLDDSGAVHKADMGFNIAGDLRDGFTVSTGTTTEELRSYNGNIQSGYPLYQNGVTLPYDTTFVSLGYRVNSPTPVNAQYSWGPFDGYYLQQINTNLTHPLSNRFNLGLEYDGTLERPTTGAENGQWLRRVTLGYSIDHDTTLSVSLRDISGTGGFATPGNNFSGILHRLFNDGNELYISFGSPNASQTIDRFVVKYVVAVGAQNY